MAEGAARRGGKPLDEEALTRESQEIVDSFNAQSSAIHTSSLLLDDGVIDPRDTREVLGLVLDTVMQARAQVVHPLQFGVARL